MTIDERIEALTMNLELVSHEIEAMRGNFEVMRGNFEAMRDGMRTLETTARLDGENIRALARIAEIHDRRLTDLERQ